MRILHLVPQLSGGGAERQLSYLAPELVRMGHQVGIAYFRNGLFEPNLPGVILYRLKNFNNYDLFILWELVRLIHRIHPDIIQTWIFQMDILGGIASRLTKTPWLLREPSCAMAYGGVWKDKLRLKVARFAAGIVSNSHGGMEYWKSYYPFKEQYFVKNGFPIDKIQAIEPLSNGELGFLNDHRIILSVGRLDPDKSYIQYLIDSIPIIMKKAKVYVVILGGGVNQNEILGKIYMMGLTKNFFLKGTVPSNDVLKWMKRSDVFCFLSEFEGFPNVVGEAMLCGCPLVVSDISAHRELLDEDSAVFVKYNDSAQIAEGINTILGSPGEAKVKAVRAKEKASQWSIRKMAQEYEQVYWKALRNCKW